MSVQFSYVALWVRLNTSTVRGQPTKTGAYTAIRAATVHPMLQTETILSKRFEWRTAIGTHNKCSAAYSIVKISTIIQYSHNKKTPETLNANAYVRFYGNAPESGTQTCARVGSREDSPRQYKTTFGAHNFKHSRAYHNGGRRCSPRPTVQINQLRWVKNNFCQFLST